MNLTLETSLKHLHSQMDDLLTDFINIHAAPFISEMNRLINIFKVILEENKSSKCSYDRSIHKSFFRVKNGG